MRQGTDPRGNPRDGRSVPGAQWAQDGPGAPGGWPQAAPPLPGAGLLSCLRPAGRIWRPGSAQGTLLGPASPARRTPGFGLGPVSAPGRTLPAQWLSRALGVGQGKVRGREAGPVPPDRGASLAKVWSRSPGPGRGGHCYPSRSSGLELRGLRPPPPPPPPPGGRSGGRGGR